MKKIIVLLSAIVLNTIVGVTAACGFDFSPVTGAIGANCLGVIGGCLGGFAPAGVLREGVLTEVWTGELVKKLRGFLDDAFLLNVPDYSSLAENDVIHLVDVGGDPDVLINNTTYPISIQELSDNDIAISLDKFQTKATPITDDELYAASYDKMQRVKDSHADAMHESRLKKALHAFAPSSNGTKTPVIATTGETDTVTLRKRITRADIIELKRKFDVMGVPTVGRRLVLCPDHVNDLLLADQKFADQYYNYTTGKIANLYGFEVYENGYCPYFTAAGAKKTFGAAASTGEFQASVAFYTKNMFKAQGTTKMYYSEAKNDTLYQRNLVNFRNYFIALPKKQEAIGAIYSAYVGDAGSGSGSGSGTGE